MKQLLSLLGATIMLGTFIAKDARRDRLKDLSDSIERAQDIYNIRDDVKSVELKVEQLTDEAWDRQHFGRAFGFRDKDDYGRDVYVMQRDLEGIITAQNLLTRIYENLSPDLSLAQTLGAVEIKKWEALKAVGQLGYSWTETLRVKRNNAPDFLPKLERTRELATSASRAIDRYTADLGPLKETILEMAEKELKKDQRADHYWTIVYYNLFSLGWLVTVAGIFIGEADEKTVVEELMDA